MNLIDIIKTGTLIGKYFTGKENTAESVQLKNWLREDPDLLKIFRELEDEKTLASAIRALDSYDRDHAWRNYLGKIAAVSLRRALVRWKAAAVFFFIVGCAALLALFKANTEPGAGNASPALYTTVSGTNGQRSKITLPDSSIVWLNAETTLSYNNDYAVSSRDIKLTGQAFFEIAPNDKIPLYVHVNEFKVKVRGTKFDVSAFPKDGRIDVVLESGSVELLHDADRSFSHMLKPGEKASFDPATRKTNVSQVDVYRYISWKDGLLIFESTPMGEVLEKLKRWYNIQIEVKDPAIYSLLFNATIINEDVDEIFDLIAYTCAVNYRILPSKIPGIPVKVILTKN
ncbi:MAG: FecR domain-containing protein [Prolixibacteraceae bacterium]